MGEQKNTIIINGKTYDTVSGKLVRDKPNQLVNDIVRIPPKTSASQSKKVRLAHHLIHHKPQKSTTLKRMPHQQRAAAIARSLPFSDSAVVTAITEKVLLPNGNRYERAKSVSKSSAISRFSLSQSQPTFVKQQAHLPVKPAPVEAPTHKKQAPAAVFKSHRSGQTFFDAALSQADSHKQMPPHTSRRKHRFAKKLGVSTRAANIIAIVAVIVVLSGFIAYQNASNLYMSAAVNRSGLSSAGLPGFRPSGFSLNRHVAASPGQVVISFHSNSDSRAFTITQVGSNWNSQTLADSYLSDKQAQRLNQPDGKTVYLYGQSDATWVDGGIWYRIEGNSSLSSDQLLKIAASF